MKTVDKARIVKGRVLRPLEATKMLWDHKRTMRYRLTRGQFRDAYNFAFTTYFVRGEDCGRNILDPIWWLFPNKTPFLWGLEMEITTRCYLRCKMCEHTFFPKDYINQDLSLDTLKSVVDNVPNLKWINLTGEGSAVLNPEFLDMIRYCKSRHIYVDFSHDFYQLSDETARCFIESGVERIFVSLDGATKETYEKIRVGSDFNKVLWNIRRFIDLKEKYKSPTPEICFRMAIFKDNAHEVEQFIDLVRSLAPTKDYGDKPEINLVGLLEFEQTKGWEVEIAPDVVDRVTRKCKEYGFTLNWSHPSHNPEDKPPLEYCLAWTEPYIIITGHVIPCCAVVMSNRRKFLEEQAFGNIKEQSLKEIWDSERYRRFRKVVVSKREVVPLICDGCRMFDTTARAEKYGVEAI